MQFNPNQGLANIQQVNPNLQQQINNQEAIQENSYQSMQARYNNTHLVNDRNITEKQKDQWFGDENGNIPIERQNLSNLFSYLREADGTSEDEALSLIKDIYMNRA